MKSNVFNLMVLKSRRIYCLIASILLLFSAPAAAQWYTVSPTPQMDGNGNLRWNNGVRGVYDPNLLFVKNQVPTAEKTSAYTAAAGDIVKTNTTGGTVPITLPNAPLAGTRVSVKMTTQGSGNTTTVSTAGSDVLNLPGGPTLYTIKTLNQSATFQYNSGIWTVLNDNLSLAQLDLRYAPSTGGGTYASSISLTTPSLLYSSPINFTNSSGAFSGALTLLNQSANTVLAGPTSGGSATPAFRALVAADIPSLQPVLTAGNNIDLTSNRVSEKTATTIYSKGYFTGYSDFTATGTTPTIVSNAIELTGGAGTLTQYLTLNNAIQSDEQKEYEMIFKPVVLGAGIGTGHRSTISNFYAESVYIQVNTLTNVVTMSAINSGYVIKTATLPYTIAIGDIIRVRYSQNITTLTATIEDITQGKINAYTASAVLLSTSPYVVPSIGNPCIWNFGGTNDVISFKFISTTNSNPDVLVVGNSKVAGLFAGGWNLRFASLLSGLGSVQVLGASSAATADFLTEVNYIISLHPKYVILADLVRNDIGGSVPAATWQANYTSIVNSLTSAGITVIHLYGMDEPTLSQTAWYTWLTANYSTNLINVLTGWSNSTMVGSDNVHPNDYGNRYIASQVKGSGLIPTKSNFALNTYDYLPKTAASVYNQLSAGAGLTFGGYDGSAPISATVDQTYPFVFTNKITYSGNKTLAPTGFAGGIISGNSQTITDATTAASGTVTWVSAYAFAQPTFAFANTGVTATNAATFFILGAPVAGTNATFTNPYALYVNNGAVGMPNSSLTTKAITATGLGTFTNGNTSGNTAALTVQNSGSYGVTMGGYTSVGGYISSNSTQPLIINGGGNKTFFGANADDGSGYNVQIATTVHMANNLGMGGVLNFLGGNNSQAFTGTSTTGYQYATLQNTGGNMRMGIENSAGGGLGTGTAAYSAVFGNAVSAGVDIIAGGVSRYSIDVNGNHNFKSGTATFGASVTANSFVKSGGTSTQFLMADGSVTGPVVYSSIFNGAGTGASPLGINTDNTVTSGSFNLITSGGVYNIFGSANTWTGNNTFNNALFTNSTQVTASGSTSGTAKFSMPFQGTSYKKVVIYLSALLGTATYTLPTAYTSGMEITYGSSHLSANTITSTSISITTSSAQSGYITIEGY